MLVVVSLPLVGERPAGSRLRLAFLQRKIHRSLVSSSRLQSRKATVHTAASPAGEQSTSRIVWWRKMSCGEKGSTDRFLYWAADREQCARLHSAGVTAREATPAGIRASAT